MRRKVESESHVIRISSIKAWLTGMEMMLMICKEGLRVSTQLSEPNLLIGFWQPATCEEQSMPFHAHKTVHPHCLQHEHSILDHYDPDAIGQAQEQQSALLACVVALRVLLASWGHVWPSMLVYLWACKTMWTLTLQCNQWLILIEAGAPVFVLLSWAIVGGVCVLPVLLTHRHSWPPRVVFVAAMALGLYLLWVFTLPVKACRKNTVDKTSTECGEGAQVIRDDMSSFSIWAVFTGWYSKASNRQDEHLQYLLARIFVRRAWVEYCVSFRWNTR